MINIILYLSNLVNIVLIFIAINTILTKYNIIHLLT